MWKNIVRILVYIHPIFNSTKYSKLSFVVTLLHSDLPIVFVVLDIQDKTVSKLDGYTMSQIKFIFFSLTQKQVDSKFQMPFFWGYFEHLFVIVATSLNCFSNKNKRCTLFLSQKISNNYKFMLSCFNQLLMVSKIINQIHRYFYHFPICVSNGDELQWICL